MKRKAKLALVLLSTLAGIATAQSSPENQSSAQDTQARGYWVDPATGLMWAAKDNGKDISWQKAMKYCTNLRLAGQSGWRLASLAELGRIYDKGTEAPGKSGREPFT